MAVSMLGGILFGMSFKQFFKCSILAPACRFTSFQIGYIVGLVARYYYRTPKRSKDFGVGERDATPSMGHGTRESGREAA